MKQKILLNLILLMFLSVQISLAQQVITGTVTSSNGEAIPGVSVVVKGTSNGTITDVNGSFSINVQGNNATLIFTTIGFTKTEKVVGSETSINVQMQEDVQNLDEIVISGLASTTKRGNLANAISTISAKDLSGVTVPQTVDGALYGKFTGVNIVSNSGAPGGGVSVKLRGITSILGSSQPLYIVDGIYVDNTPISSNLNFLSAAAAGGNASSQDNATNRIADISLEDIETIEVLKGPSAASIYGSRSGAGVIVITTKRGNTGGTRVSFDQTVGFSNAINLLGTRQWNEQRVASTYGADEVPTFVAARNAGKIFNYEDELYGETGVLLNSVLNVSGGNDKTTFYASVVNKDEEGIVQKTGYKKTSFRLNLNHKFNDFIELSTSANYVLSKTDRGYFNNDNTGTTLGISYLSTPSWADLFPDANGNYPNNPYAPANFLQTRDLMTNNEEVRRFMGGASLSIRLFQNEKQNLKLIASGGLDSYSFVSTVFAPRELQFQSNGAGVNGASIQGNTVVNNYNVQAFLVHNYAPSAKLTFNSQAGILSLNFDRDTKIAVASQLIGTQTNLDQAGSLQISQIRQPEEDFGFFIQEEVNYDDKIIATVGLRADKSSNNGDANKLYYYPKANVAFNLHEFDFWSGIKSTVSQLKLRVAYGQAGRFATFGSTFTPLNNVLIGGQAGSLISTTRGNSNVGPERQSELEVGFDASFINNRFGLTVTYYNKNVTDLLLNRQVPLSSGFSSEIINGADLKNEGLEIGLKAQIISNSKFQWSTSVQYWFNRSEITRLDVPAFNLGGFGATLGTYRLEEGQSATQIVGIDDANGDGTSDGIKVFGDSDPRFQMSWSNNLAYKNFELNFLWHLKNDYQNINLSTLLFDLNGTSPDYDGTNIDPSGVLNNGNYRVSRLGVSADVFVEDASYLRLREVGLFYNIRQKALGNFFSGAVKGIRVGVSAFNLLNFFKYNSYDPEVSNFGGDGLSSGVEVAPFPSARRIYFHFNIQL
jgi:TonB-linked SusC/RagA family outer membrane protein